LPEPPLDVQAASPIASKANAASPGVIPDATLAMPRPVHFIADSLMVNGAFL
jgi:hypothetical protein